MKVTINTESQALTVEEQGISRDLPLYSREAFEVVSREWVRIGWGVDYYFTMTWFGRAILQLPQDLVRLQQVVAALEPDVIMETGIYNGGSLLFHATLCEGLGKGRVIGIDIHIDQQTRTAVERHRLAHRISMIECDSTSPAAFEAVSGMLRPAETVLVILDSHHSKEHVSRELRLWSPLVTPGSCILVADGIMRDLTDVPGAKAEWATDNPRAAVHDFLRDHPEFELRQPAWPCNITYWPDGWLWRKT